MRSGSPETSWLAATRRGRGGGLHWFRFIILSPGQADLRGNEKGEQAAKKDKIQTYFCFVRNNKRQRLREMQPGGRNKTMGRSCSLSTGSSRAAHRLMSHAPTGTP
ncbi:hypothetical protein MAPG_05771 [Magnaporthiopsis poae ATCC 64411]|uniref:Uncharacterized protein n=1 Tax=Magnaporthiopsis poae (strain ATCC 64411 / 73-15) TaxID=644358 RepID=A0A0C4E0A2_MAGP6|nr:hypothetical protein MAPG_05771 [Magnaporthiopsis poae ATCC 64411]